WTKAGAKVAIGHQDVNSLPGFFFPHFLRRWAEGRSALEAATLAHRLSARVAGKLEPYVEERELLSRVGVSRSAPVLAGVDVDRRGREFPERSLELAPVRRPVPLASFMTFEHSTFERTSIELMSAALPRSRLNVGAFPSVES